MEGIADPGRAASQKELVEEGDALHHCVGTYAKDHANGKTAIFFVRRVKESGNSYFTLELDEGKLTVRQNRGDATAPVRKRWKRLRLSGWPGFAPAPPGMPEADLCCRRN